jgi:hypothetical protein
MNKPQTKTAMPWLDCLIQEQGLKKVLERAKNHDALTLAVRKAVEHLGYPTLSQSLMVEWRPEKPNELLLIAPNSTIASRIQQLTPSITQALHQTHRSIEIIKVKVRPRESQVHLINADSKPPDFTHAAWLAWENLLHELPPESSLREAVERLLKHRAVKR